MKKLFTLLFVAVVATAARATDYDVPLTITVNGVSVEQNGNISVVDNNGLYDLTVKNFMLQSTDGPIGVGNVEVKGIKPYQDGDATLLLTKQIVTITPGDDPNVPFWLASSLPAVPVDLRGKIVNGTLRCYLDINLESLEQVIQVAIGGDKGYQMPNPSFEDWHTSTGSYVEPNSWHSFESATGNLVSMAGHHIEKSDDAHSGDASARIFSTEVNAVFFKVIANGTMTTGRMNAGSASAADAKGNYAYLDMNKKDDNNQTPTDGNGDPFYTPLYSRPDALSVWVKFKQETANASHPYATISAAITDGTRYQDPEDKEYTNVVAKAKNNTIATTNGEWKEIVIPFEYTDNAVDPKAVLVTISTNADAGQGSDKDEVLVDDIAFIYNAKVTGMKIKGQDVTGFSADKTDYEIELNEVITADDIEVTVEGKAAHVVKEVTKEDGSYVCKVSAISADMSVMTTYVVKVKSNATAISSMKPATAQTATYYTLDGRQVYTLTPGNTYISRQADGTTTKIRR